MPDSVNELMATLKLGATGPAVRAVQERLNAIGCGPVDVDGVFGSQTASAIRLYQARFTDEHGLPLKIDGEVGPLTWNALMGREADRSAVTPRVDTFLANVLETAAKEIGVMEDPIGSNRGPKVDLYLRTVGLDPTRGSFPWCGAYVYWCFAQTCSGLGVDNPAIKSAGVMDHWRKAGLAGIRRITAAEAAQNPGLVTGGLVFFISTGEGTGHMGFVEGIELGKLVTLEGNTNSGGSREGVGVFRRALRKIGDINMGFVDYAR